jgi:hypothetical protein
MKDWNRISENPSWDASLGSELTDEVNGKRDYNWSGAHGIGLRMSINYIRYQNTIEPQDDIVFLQNNYFWYGKNNPESNPPVGMVQTEGGDPYTYSGNLDYRIVSDYLNNNPVDPGYQTRYDTLFKTEGGITGWITRIFAFMDGHMYHEMGHHWIGVTYGLPPTGLFSGNGIPEWSGISVGHEIFPDGVPDCRYRMAVGGCGINYPGKGTYHNAYSPIDWAYMHNRIIINRMFDIKKVYEENDYCVFYPGADNPFGVGYDSYQDTIKINRYTIVAPGVLGDQ